MVDVFKRREVTSHHPPNDRQRVFADNGSHGSARMHACASSAAVHRFEHHCPVRPKTDFAVAGADTPPREWRIDVIVFSSCF